MIILKEGSPKGVVGLWGVFFLLWSGMAGAYLVLRTAKIRNRTNLIMNDFNSSSLLFDNYLLDYGQDICPDDGSVFIINGNLQCEIHSDTEENDEDETVPYL